MKPIRWTLAFALSWLVLSAGLVIGFGVVEWTKRLEEKPLAAAPHIALPGAEEAELPDEERKSGTDLFLLIFSRNVTVYVWLLAGLLSAGVITFMVLLANGALLGQTIGMATGSGMSASTVVDLLLPHGVLELGTFCIAGAVGFQGFRLALDWSQFNRQLMQRTRLGAVFAFGVVALAVAAGIEAVVTADLAEALGSAK